MKKRDDQTLDQVIEACAANVREAAQLAAQAARDLDAAGVGSAEANRARAVILRAKDERRHWEEMRDWWTRCRASRPDLAGQPARFAADAWFYGNPQPEPEPAADESIAF